MGNNAVHRIADERNRDNAKSRNNGTYDLNRTNLPLFTPYIYAIMTDYMFRKPITSRMTSNSIHVYFEGRMIVFCVKTTYHFAKDSFYEVIGSKNGMEEALRAF